MFTFADLPRFPDGSGDADVEQLTRLDSSKIRLLWHYDYWDAPLSGPLLYEGQKYWFEMAKRYRWIYEDSDEAEYLVIELSSAQLAEVEYWHELFRQKVGTHTEYHNNKRTKGELKPGETRREYYSAREGRQPLDLSSNTVVGYFEF
jgi:hypothetical protein